MCRDSIDDESLNAADILKQLNIKPDESIEIPDQPEQLNMIEIQELYQ